MESGPLQRSGADVRIQAPTSCIRVTTEVREALDEGRVFDGFTVVGNKVGDLCVLGAAAATAIWENKPVGLS